jgi:hypothetical protein
MPRMTVTEAERDFPAIVNRVCSDGITVDLERDHKIVARLTPAALQSPLKVRDLNDLMRSLPPLGADADAFERDIRELRQLTPAEANPWE